MGIFIREIKKSQAEDLNNTRKVEVKKGRDETTNSSGDQSEEIRDEGAGKGEEFNDEGAKWV